MNLPHPTTKLAKLVCPSLEERGPGPNARLRGETIDALRLSSGEGQPGTSRKAVG